MFGFNQWHLVLQPLPLMRGCRCECRWDAGLCGEALWLVNKTNKTLYKCFSSFTKTTQNKCLSSIRLLFLCFIVKYGETAAPERGHRWKLADNTALCKWKAGWIIKEIGGREAYKRSVRESFWKCKAVRGPIPNCPWRGSCFVCFSVLLPGNREWDSQSQCRLSPLRHCF